MVYATRSSFFNWLIELLTTAALFPLFTGTSCADEPPPAAPPETLAHVTYQLANVTVPPDSPIRKVDSINHPPAIYVILRIKGEQIGKYSQVRKGWDVDFETTTRNQWPIWDDSRKIYSLELWDSNWGGDDMILSVTGLSGTDFKKGVIYEKGGVNTPKDRLVVIRFEPISLQTD